MKSYRLARISFVADALATAAVLWWMAWASAAPRASAADSADSAVSGPPSAASRQLHQLFNDEWEWRLRESPAFASYQGDRRYNRQWNDVSLEAIERRHQHRQELLQQIDSVDVEQLPATDRLNLRLFRWELEADIEAHAYRWHLMPLTQREGIQDESQLADAMSFRTMEDYDDWIARLVAFPSYMDQTMALMRAGISARLLQPKVVMARLPHQIRQQIVDDPRASLYFKPFKTLPAGFSEEDRQRLADAAARAIAEHVTPAYRRFAKFFDEEYYPACYEQVGIWQAPRGEEAYAARARRFTTTSLSVDEIHEIGLREVARIRREMETIQKQVEFAGDFPQFLEHLRTDRRYYYDSPDDLFQAYQALCKRIDPHLTKLFRKLPRTPYGIEPIPIHIAPDTTTAYYRQPSADGRRAGAYFVNLYRPEVRPKYEMEALSLHEAVPGHHLQLALAMELEDVPTFRRFSEITAFVEGWALYSESLGGELGCYQDPYSKFGQLTYEIWRAIRLVVDTGIHAKRWSRDRAIQYFRDNSAKTDQDIVNEIDRYISWPGQALAYKIGELKIRELRAKAERSLGERFDVREFHDAVLRNGSLPLAVLEEMVDEWIAERQRAS